MKISGHKFLNQQEIFEELNKPFSNRFSGKESEYLGEFINEIGCILQKFGFSKIKKIEQEKRIGSRYIDLFITHEDTTVSILEVKCKKEIISKDEQFKSIGQILLYNDIFQSIHSVQPRLFLVDQKIYIDTWKIIFRHKLPINLLQFQYDNVVLLGAPKTD